MALAFFVVFDGVRIAKRGELGVQSTSTEEPCAAAYRGCQVALAIEQPASSQLRIADELRNEIEPPYYQTSMHLHGGASGGPVFNGGGRVFGIASSSYEGAVDLAFVTPVIGVLEIEFRENGHRRRSGPRRVTVSELAKLGHISIGAH